MWAIFLHRSADVMLLLIINFYWNVLRLLDVETSVNTIIIQPTLHIFINFIDTHPKQHHLQQNWRCRWIPGSDAALRGVGLLFVFPVRSLEKLLLSEPKWVVLSLSAYFRCGQDEHPINHSLETSKYFSTTIYSLMCCSKILMSWVAVFGC